MVHNLLRAGHQVTVHNRTRTHAEPLRQGGAVLADSPAEAARNVDAVVTMLADDQAVENAVKSFAETLAPGALHIGMSTISVAGSRRLADVTPGWSRVMWRRGFSGGQPRRRPRSFGSWPPAPRNPLSGDAGI